MSTGGMMSGPGGKGGPPSGGTGGFMGGPGGPQQGGQGMGAGGFMAGGGGKGASPGGMGAGGFMANSMGGPQGNQTGGFMGQGGPQGPGAGQGGYMQADAYDQNAALGGAGQPLMSNGSGVAAIEKRLEWRMLFFVGALCVFVAGIVSIFHFVISFGDVKNWSPCTFISCCFLLIFGVLMIVLDFPAPTLPVQMQHIYINIYTFALFLTRFTGRGIWYVFLGTHTWVALYDDSINSFFGIVFTLYLVLLGIAAAAKGMFLSYRLHRVQLDLTEKRVQPQQFMTQQMGMQTAEFKLMCQSVMPATEAQFTEAEYGYIVNALNFKPRNDGMVTTEELDYWLQKGPMLLV